MECRQWVIICHTFVYRRSHILISMWLTNWWTGKDLSVVSHTLILQMSCVIFCSNSQFNLADILAILHKGVSYLCMFNVTYLFMKLHAMKAYRGNRGIAPIICTRNTRWKWMVNATFQVVQPQRKSPHYLLNMGLGEPQKGFGHFGDENSLLPLLWRDQRPSSL